MAGVGKSTIVSALAAHLRYKFTDLDDYIRERDQQTIQEIIDSRGDQALLHLEKQRMFEIDLNQRVIAPGGSIIYHSDLMNYLKKNCTIVYLEDTFENVRSRIKDASARGIVGFKNKSLHMIYDERQPLYSQYADITVKPEDKSLDEVVQEITNRL